MYQLKEYWEFRQLPVPNDSWDGNIICIETDTAITMGINDTDENLACYTFTLVIEGSMTLRYNDNDFTINKGALYCYSPGFPVKALSVSENYRGLCLLADEQFTLDIPKVREAIRTYYFSLVELHKPCIQLSNEEQRHIHELMQLVIYYQQSNLSHATDSLNMIYQLFLNSLADLEGFSVSEPRVPKRAMELFTGFQNLVSKHFIEHHDIGFYASELCVTTTYLSRIVRQVSEGHTVVDYINRLLIMEATFLLRNTSLSVAQIADRLHFAETTTFARFFRRMRGVTPRKFRES